MRLTSPAFEDGAQIPERFGHEAADVNPPLRVADVPNDAGALAVVMDDPDAVEPAGKVWDHWVLWNVPPDRGTIPEDYDPAADGAVEGANDFGGRGYGGPAPPDRRHTYEFTAYALDRSLDLDAGATKAALRDAMDGRVVEEAGLSGTYAP